MCDSINRVFERRFKRGKCAGQRSIEHPWLSERPEPPPGHVVILANGVWSNPETILRLAGDADAIIAADGAWAKAKQLGIDVSLVVGDLDSIGEEEAKQLADSSVPTLAFPVDKDRTDTEIAVDLALEWRVPRISICGVGGGRMDHALGHAFLLGKCPASQESEARLELVSGSETAVWVEGEIELNGACLGDRVSILPIDFAVRVSTTGLRFPLTNELLHRPAGRGISNAVCALPARVRICEGAAIVIHNRPHRASGAEPPGR